MNKIRVSILALACSAGVASSATIDVTYSFTGVPVDAGVMSGTTLVIDHLSTGSIVSSNSSLNIIWNPFTLLSHDVVDYAAGTLNGASTITFADGSTLFGHQFVDFTSPLVPETFTFNGGTGEFAGATGSLSGESVVSNTAFSVSGSGTINAPAIAPEPESVALSLGGLAVLLIMNRLSKVKRSWQQKQ